MSDDKQAVTDYHLPTSELMQAAQTIADAGGPVAGWVGEKADVDLKDLRVLVEDIPPHGEPDWGYSPRLVAAAVIAYAGEVRAWWKIEHQRGSSLEMDWLTRHWDQRIDLPSGNSIGCQHPSQLSAAAALITAVASAVGEGE